MDIYYRKSLVLSILFAIPALLILLVQLDVIDYSNKESDLAAYTVMAICVFFSVLTAFASTRMYFDNDQQACIQLRKHFYGKKEVRHAYADILAIELRLRLQSTNRTGAYKVGLTRSTSILGQAAVEFIELKCFTNDHRGKKEAEHFAKSICDYSGLSFIDTTFIKRPL
ncbi:hypothetical protein [Agaribacterium sp. ZY112]|uniref:hypothetical protein n=1 Tax=Agaribacterium sp. ZY112 TaxID=3233574 RepID=UPI0035249AE6